MKCRVGEVGSNVRDCNKSCCSTRAAELEPEKLGEDCEKDSMFDKPNVYTKQGSGSGAQAHGSADGAGGIFGSRNKWDGIR
jgi:hypothetical protein